MGAIPFHQLRVFAAGLVCGLLTCMAYLHLAGVRYYAVMDADLSRTPLAGPVRGARERPPARLRPHHSGIVGGSYAHLHGGPTLYVSHDRWLNVASIFTDDMVCDAHGRAPCAVLCCPACVEDPGCPFWSLRPAGWCRCRLRDRRLRSGAGMHWKGEEVPPVPPPGRPAYAQPLSP